MEIDYRTIAENGKFEEVIRKSTFICHLKRTDSEEEALEFIEEIKKEHYKATHNCSAYLIGENNDIQRANDDGEPSGTAGLPMLEVLKKNHLKNVTAVVTRYFGGVKLGAGGLIRAYGGSVSQALKELRIVERILMQQIQLTVPYTLSGKVENDLRDSAYILEDTQYTDEVTFVCLVKRDEVEAFNEFYTNLTSAKAEFNEATQKFVEIPV